MIGYDQKANQYYIDRSKSGKTDFEKGFGQKHIAVRLAKDPGASISIVADVASVELFADGGLTAMTDIFFPETPMSRLTFKSVEGITFDNVKYTSLKSSVK